MGDVLLDTAVNHLCSWNLSIEIQRITSELWKLKGPKPRLGEGQWFFLMSSVLELQTPKGSSFLDPQKAQVQYDKQQQ